MSIFSVFFGRNESKRISQLERKVEELEAAVFETTRMLKQLASLSLQTAKEVEILAEHIKHLDNKPKPSVFPKKNDDFYN